MLRPPLNPHEDDSLKHMCSQVATSDADGRWFRRGVPGGIVDHDSITSGLPPEPVIYRRRMESEVTSDIRTGSRDLLPRLRTVDRAACPGA